MRHIWSIFKETFIVFLSLSVVGLILLGGVFLSKIIAAYFHAGDGVAILIFFGICFFVTGLIAALLTHDWETK